MNQFAVFLKLIQYCKSTTLQEKLKKKKNQKLEFWALLSRFLGHMTLDKKKLSLNSYFLSLSKELLIAFLTVNNWVAVSIK